MRIFMTGATGFIGSAIVQELKQAGHKVLALARSDANAKSLAAAGAEPHRGDLQDLKSLRAGAAKCDGVIHAGFIHDFTKFKENCEIDRRAIEAIGSAFEGSRRPIVITSGIGVASLSPGRLVTEETGHASGPHALPRVASEEAAKALASRGVHVSLLRLPPTVHGDGDHGFVPMLINLAREKRVSAYVGEGSNRWSAVHRLDAARLYRLVVERGVAGEVYHGVAEEGVPFRDIAGAIGRGLKHPVSGKSTKEAADHFGWFAHFAGFDAAASSAQTQRLLGWEPREHGLLADLDSGSYFKN